MHEKSKRQCTIDFNLDNSVMVTGDDEFYSPTCTSEIQIIFLKRASVVTSETTELSKTIANKAKQQ